VLETPKMFLVLPLYCTLGIHCTPVGGPDVWHIELGYFERRGIQEHESLHSCRAPTSKRDDGKGVQRRHISRPGSRPKISHVHQSSSGVVLDP
jgi:hypothetical protein